MCHNEIQADDVTVVSCFVSLIVHIDELFTVFLIYTTSFDIFCTGPAL